MTNPLDLWSVLYMKHVDYSLEVVQCCFVDLRSLDGVQARGKPSARLYGHTSSEIPALVGILPGDVKRRCEYIEVKVLVNLGICGISKLSGNAAYSFLLSTAIFTRTTMSPERPHAASFCICHHSTVVSRTSAA